MNEELLHSIMESLDPARDLSDETLNELLPHDQLMARIASGIAAEAPAAARTKATSRWRRIPTSVGAAVAACSVVIAGALMLFGSSPALVQGTGVAPIITQPPPVLKIVPQPVDGGTAETFKYDFTADPTLSTAVGSATAYELTSPTDVATLTSEIASALGVSSAVAYLGPGNYQAGPSGGPDVVVGTVAGVLQWQYPTWTDQPPGSSVSANEDFPVPSDSQATADARRMLLAVGVNALQLGAPQISRYSAAVNVEFPMVVDGLSTDKYSQVEYGFGATVLTASGIVATATPSDSYPTISPAQAASLLGSSSAHATSSTSSGPTESSGSNVVSVNINQATPVLSTYELADGTSWLLPTWALSGPESGSSVTTGSKYMGSILAVGTDVTSSVDSRTPSNAGSERGVTTTGTRLVVPKCKPSQIDEWMTTESGPYVATRNYKARVIYTNTGKVCALARAYVGVQAVAGKDHSPVGMGSLIPSVALIGSITLPHGYTAAASIVIGSTSSSSFRQMLKDHMGTCAPKYANAIRVFGFNNEWPAEYFTLPTRFPVCTSNFFNVSAGILAKTKRIVIHG